MSLDNDKYYRKRVTEYRASMATWFVVAVLASIAAAFQLVTVFVLCAVGDLVALAVMVVLWIVIGVVVVVAWGQWLTARTRFGESEEMVRNWSYATKPSPSDPSPSNGTLPGVAVTMLYSLPSGRSGLLDYDDDDERRRDSSQDAIWKGGEGQDN